MAKKRAKRGTVTVGKCHGTLRLLWSYQGKRYTVSLGMEDTPWHRSLAQKRALWMEREIAYGRFDPAQIERYRQHLRGTEPLIDELADPPIPPLGQIWQQYMETKKQGKSPATIRQYGWVARHIERLPIQDIRQSQLILDAIALLNPGTQKRLLTQINACTNWAMKSELIEVNPFIGQAGSVKVAQRGTVKGEIRPFTRSERDRVLEAFQNNPYYRHYAEFVEFLFYTGARPSEVIPLQWRQVGLTEITFDQAMVYNGHGYQVKAGLKTQQSRRFPINSQLKVLLDRMQRKQNLDLVFPSREGTYISWNNFNQRVWKQVIQSLPDIEYRNPYQMRHSFISYCRELNIPSIQIAEWVGNSAEMIDRVYARSTQQIQVPEL